MTRRRRWISIIAGSGLLLVCVGTDGISARQDQRFKPALRAGFGPATPQPQTAETRDLAAEARANVEEMARQRDAIDCAMVRPVPGIHSNMPVVKPSGELKHAARVITPPTCPVAAASASRR